jgi:hypothetical protein
MIGLSLIIFGMFFLVYGTGFPVYYAGGGTGISQTVKVVGGLAPEYCEIPIFTLPNTIHIHVRSIEPVIVRIDAPNDTTLVQCQNITVNEDYVVSGCGYWKVYVSQPSGYFVYGEVFATAPVYAHPALAYATIPLLLGSLSIIYSLNKRRHARYFENILFQQNIGGRWVFLGWVFILAFITQLPTLIPSYPWLYPVLIFITVLGVFSSVALAYVKIYLATGGLLIEAPFLNSFRRYQISQIYGYTITKEKRQRWFFLMPIPSFRAKMEDQVTIFMLDPLPAWFWVLSLGKRLQEKEIILRPKSAQNFKTAAERLQIPERKIATI